MIIPNLSDLLPLALPHIFSSHSPADSTSRLAASTEHTDGIPAAYTNSKRPSKATIVIPHRQPAFAERIDPHLVAFSIEADRWPDWAGAAVGAPNEFAKQVLKNLEERSGVPPAIRVGADSEDRTHLNLSHPVGLAIYPPKTPWFPYPEAERIEIGRDWYRLSQNFAPGTPFTWGLNLKSLDMAETLRQAKHLREAFQVPADKGASVSEDTAESSKERRRVNLEAVEIGNEPELYYRPQSGGGVDNPGDWTQWSVKNYTATWLQYAKAAAKELHVDEEKSGEGEGTVLRIGDIQFAGSASGWAPQSIIQAGLFDDEDDHHAEDAYAKDDVATLGMAGGSPLAFGLGLTRDERLQGHGHKHHGEPTFARKHVKVYSEHMYQSNYAIGHEAVSGVLMDKWHVRGNLSVRATDVLACKKEGMHFVLEPWRGRARSIGYADQQGETSTYSSHGSPGTSNTAESALWAIDYLLQAASIGVSRAYLSHGVGYRYSSFQPISGITDDGRGLDRAHVMPLYYGLLVVNEAIGPVSGGDGTGYDREGREGAIAGHRQRSEGYVLELSTEHPNIVSYGIYEHGRLGRIVLVNTHVRAQGKGGGDAAGKDVEVDLQGLRALIDRSGPGRTGIEAEVGEDEEKKGKRVVMKRLHVPYTAAVAGLTWAGQDFDTPSGKPKGEVRTEELEGETVLVHSSSAVLLVF